MPAVLSKPRQFRVRCTFLPRKDYIWVMVDPSGSIQLREPSARRWLNFPIARIYTLASIAATPPRIARNQSVAVLGRRSTTETAQPPAPATQTDNRPLEGH